MTGVVLTQVLAQRSYTPISDSIVELALEFQISKVQYFRALLAFENPFFFIF